VLIARLHGEAVSAPRDEVPLTELPMLGGDAFLRGYPYARFRDRLAAVGSLQYMWNVSQYAEAYVFGDVGRVYEGYNQLTLSGLRAGFGVGLEFHSEQSFLVDATIASSIDGGIVLLAAFSPVLDARPRWR
jgi:outer membrane translocation and assembly module TamA